MKKQGKSGGAKKYGRNKKPMCGATSLYAKGLITFEEYSKKLGKT